MTVRLITITDDYYGMSRRDVELARQISAVAREQGVSADPSAVQTPAGHPGRPGDRRGDAVLAGRARL